MTKRKAKKRKTGHKGLVILLIILIAVAVLLALLIKNRESSGKAGPLSSAINRTVAEKAVDTIIANTTGTDTTVKEIQSKMTQEDSDTVDDILDKYAQSGLINEAISSFTENGGDLGSVYQEMQDQVDPSDMETLMELYAKYGQ